MMESEAFFKHIVIGISNHPETGKVPEWDGSIQAGNK